MPKNNQGYIAHKNKGKDMSNLLSLLEDVQMEEVVEGKENRDLEGSAGINFIKTGGVYKTTIERAFLKPTKKKGLSLGIHTKGDNVVQLMLFPINIDKKTGKRTTTNTFKGKTTTNGDFKLLKQLLFVCGESVSELKDMKVKEEEITYKAYGKEVTETVLLLTSCTDKEIGIGVKGSYEYNYEDGETDKTSYKVDNEGTPRLKLSLNSVYNSKGKTPIEMIKKEESVQLAKDKLYLESEKSIYKPKLEESEVEVVDSEVEDMEIPF